MEGRVRWFRGLARNFSEYSAPIIGTPCEVPEPRKIKENDISENFFCRRLAHWPNSGRTISAMLSTLRIKHLALAADLTLELQPGLNVITGETGAGKSILIGALNLVLGERADRTLIRSGNDSCSVEAVFHVSRLKAPLKSFLDEHGLEPCQDRQLLLKRTLAANGANRQFVNGSPTAL